MNEVERIGGTTIEDGARTDAVPSVVLDRNLFLHTWNGAAARCLFGAPGSSRRRGPTRYGEAAGCINALVEGLPCRETTRCVYCPLSQSVERAIDEGLRIAQVRFERTYVVRGRLLSRAYDLDVLPLDRRRRRGEPPLALVSMLRPEDDAGP